MNFIEHLWCSLENLKTKSFHQYLVNFVIKIIRFIEPCHSERSAAKWRISLWREIFSKSVNRKNSVLHRTSMMFLIELKNEIISPILSEFCDKNNPFHRALSFWTKRSKVKNLYIMKKIFRFILPLKMTKCFTCNTNFQSMSI